MSSFIIEGGQKVTGDITPSGNKNEALPVLAACLLSKKPVILKRVPRIKDVLTLCQIMVELGARVEWQGDDQVTVCAENLSLASPNKELCEKIRASILLLGPLLARNKQVRLPLPGGDVIGARRMDTHFEGIEAVGGVVTLDQEIEARIENVVSSQVYLDEPSVTATENMILLTVLGSADVVIHNAACEPHVVGLCHLLNQMGAKIKGVGSNILHIQGVSELSGAEHEIGPDFMEIGSFLCLGAIGGGTVQINQIKPEDLRFIFKTFGKLGIVPEVYKDSLVIDGKRPLVMKTDISGRVASIYSCPWPAFPTDLMSVAIVAATQAQGTMIFHEKMFEGRMFFTDKLLGMGANIVLCDPHRIVVNGPTRLMGAHLSSPDVRAGMASLMAAIVAKGKSKIDNIYQIERGYFNIEAKLAQLGVAIQSV